MGATGEINELLRNAAGRAAKLSGRVNTGESRGPFARFRSTKSMQRQVSKAFDGHGPHAPHGALSSFSKNLAPRSR